MGAARDPPPPFEVLFRFESASGEHKRRLIELLGLRELAERASLVDRKALGLRRSDCLNELDGTATPLRYLVIEERATTGMYGPWTAARSKLYLALDTVGFTAKTGGEGGSYGYGKAGLIRGSATRTVLAYTCFEERPDDPGVTRRLMGMTYWDQHEIGDDAYTGSARFGERHSGGTITPFKNEAADSVAASLGLEVRNPAEARLLGTTFLAIEPTVDECDLVRAIERNWWPALQEGELHAVVDGSNEKHFPKPRRDAVLRSFIDALELATIPQDNASRDERRLHELQSGGRTLGSLGLVADRDGWSYPEQTGSQAEQGIDHRNLVALVREPRMVVEYLPLPPQRRTGPPYVRGVFVADEGINEALRDTEPMGHNAWQTNSDNGGAEQAALAKAVIDTVGKRVTDFRRSLKPPARPAEDIRLDFFDSQMRRLLRAAGSGRTGPPTDTRPVSIGLHYGPEEAGEGAVRLAGRTTISLSEHFEGDEAPARVTIRYRLVEDETARGEIPLRVAPPAGFTRVPGDETVFEGQLSHTAVVFGFVSEPYRADWTGRLSADAEISEQGEA